MTDRLSRIAGWAVVVVVAVATWAGLVKRFLTPEGAPYLLLSRELAHRPVVAVLLLAVTMTAYAAAFRWLCHALDDWREPARPVAGFADVPAEPDLRRVRLVHHLFARWWRVSLALAVVWLPIWVTSFPGQPSQDPANMFSEFLDTRSDFPLGLATAGIDRTAPFDNYPTSSYLVPDGPSLWSDHHPFFLMLAFGAVAWVSAHLFGSLMPAIFLLSFASACFTLVAFGRALAILGRYVTSWRRRGLALLVVAATPLIAAWGLAIHKNQLFCAAFVWWLALLADLLHHRGPLRRLWWAESLLVSVVMATSVQFGWMVLLAQCAALLLVRGARVPSLLTMAAPAVLVTAMISIGVGAGAIIPSDPIETKGIQLQELGLMLREHPDALTPQERAELSRVFDLDALAASFDPSSADPAKSTGPLDEQTASFRWRTVQESDWEPVDGIVARLAVREPATFVDGLFLKSYRYLDPLDEGTTWYPPWLSDFRRSVDGYRVAPVGFNHAPRAATKTAAYACYEWLPCRPLVSPTTKTVVGVLLLAAAIAVRRRRAWLWALPFALQLAIAGASPLSAGGRYVLCFVYGLGIILLLLAINDEAPAPGTGGRTGVGSPDALAAPPA